LLPSLRSDRHDSLEYEAFHTSWMRKRRTKHLPWYQPKLEWEPMDDRGSRRVRKRNALKVVTWWYWISRRESLSDLPHWLSKLTLEELEPLGDLALIQLVELPIAEEFLRAKEKDEKTRDAYSQGQLVNIVNSCESLTKGIDELFLSPTPQPFLAKALNRHSLEILIEIGDFVKRVNLESWGKEEYTEFWTRRQPKIK
jgi:hypothetical protein